jgi:hypothetical protein
MEGMSQVRTSRLSNRRPKQLCAAVAVLAALSLSACKEAEEETAAGYEPSKLVSVKGKGEDGKQVVFTKEGATRTDVKTAKVQRSGPGTVVPYEALLYDSDAKPLVYTSKKPLTYEQVRVTVDRIEGQRVYLSKGPAVGTDVVTRGATEVYGTQLEIAGSH